VSVSVSFFLTPVLAPGSETGTRTVVHTPADEIGGWRRRAASGRSQGATWQRGGSRQSTRRSSQRGRLILSIKEENIINTHHADTYFKAMSNKDFAQIAPHLSENVVLLSPVFPEPFEGKETVVKVLSGLLETIDSIQINRMLASDYDIAVSFTIECDGITVIGNEFIRLDENGLIERFEVAWRPLASATLIQEKLANKLGGQPMRLVPA
jgi:SnoaL-like domain